MEIKLFLTLSLGYIPIVAILFVSVLLIYKAYTLIRSKFKILVNCWFCNHNLKVPYDLRNSWHCPNCEQYNGFTEDGDYNCEIQAQLDCSPPTVQYAHSNSSPKRISAFNGLCETCNENQRIIIEKLAQFEPKNEQNFDKELQKYKSILEQRHRLCVSCERHVCKVLREKKKIILGSKLAAFVLQSVNNIKTYPLLKQVKKSKKLFLKNISSVCLLGLAVINFAIIINELIETRARKIPVSEDPLTRVVYLAMSHLVVFGKVIAEYLRYILKIKIIEKGYLYIKTLVILSYYTLGYRFGKSTIINIDFVSSSSVSFGSIFLAFINNILDGFKLGKSALLLTTWSVYAGIVNSTTVDFYGMDILKVATSIAAIVLSFPSFKGSNKELLDSTTNSFHRIYSEDYLNDSTKDKSSLFNSTLHNISNKNISLNSSGSSIKSFAEKPRSPRFLSPTKRRTEMNSSAFNLNSPVTNFQPLSPGNTIPSNNINHRLPNPFVDSNMYSCNNNSNLCRPMSALSSGSFVTCSQQPIHQNNRDYTILRKLNNNQHPMHSVVDNSQKNNFSTLSPSSPFMFSPNNSIYRQNIVSPSRLGIQAYAMQSSWVSGGYFNNPNIYGQKNYFLDSTCPKETVSRASSQSSGFESLQNGEQIFSRENSYCPDDFHAPQCEMNFDKLNNNGRILENSIGLLPQFQTGKSFTSYNHTNSPPPPACSPALSCQSYASNYFTDHTVFNNPMNTARNISSSPFDLNKMSEDLPSIQRGSLLRKWKDQNIII